MKDRHLKLKEKLLQIGTERYHNKHPFHQRLHGGHCSIDEIRAWVINRWAYQSIIPQKDAALIARCNDPEIRRFWRKRLEDHDGEVHGGGGLRRWLLLASAVGLDSKYVASGKGVLPVTNFIVNSYIDYVRQKPLLQAIASSLTELFAAEIHQERITGFLKHYEFANSSALSYFQSRINNIPDDLNFGLVWILNEADTREKEEQVCDALKFKMDILWAQLDAIWFAYVKPGFIPPGSWNLKEGVDI